MQTWQLIELSVEADVVAGRTASVILSENVHLAAKVVKISNNGCMSPLHVVQMSLKHMSGRSWKADR